MREIMGDHYAYCLAAGIKIAGMNVESGQAQGEFQIGPCRGINAGDHLIAARHILHKSANKYRTGVTFKPWMEDIECCNGLHTNMSTLETRMDGGLKAIDYICKELMEA